MKKRVSSVPKHPKVTLVLAEKPSASLVFGAEEIKRALEEKGHRVTINHSPGDSDIQIFLGQSGDPYLARTGKHHVQVSQEPESFAIVHTSEKAIRIEGSDAAGGMYGALDLAEQVRWADGAEFIPQIKEVRKSPFLAIRGINKNLTAQGFDEPDSWYWSDGYWVDYLDMMARNRYNFLDLHGPFDLTVPYVNGMPFFVWLPDFPEVGAGRERAEKNLARFREIIRMAADRGVKIGFMNYVAAAPIGPWKTAKFWQDERWVPRPQEFLPDDQLQEYTRQAVSAFLKEVPELWMFGFRVGESGQPEDFYKKTYLAALQETPASLKVYCRTWIADPQKVREIAESCGHPFYIEPKYNGEHLGLPYQAVTGGREYPPSGSYEDYTNYPRNFSIIWQIRANGTHRIFHWGSPDFARRVARSCKFGGGDGYSMEPMNAYYPETDYLHNNPATNHKYSQWIFEQQWFWYQVWGRTAFDPDVSDRPWTDEFENRFGAEAGSQVYRALVESSKIVPFVYASHCQGLDHQHMAPEYETGDHGLTSRDRLWQGSRLVPYGGSNDEFLRATVLDPTTMADPVTYVDDYLKRNLNGKMTPFEAASYLGAAADASEEESEKAAGLSPGARKEFECIRMDIKAVAWLARYYRDRILSATHLQFYRRTYHHPELTAAFTFLEKAIADWEQLSAITTRHFDYVPELIRMGVYKFRWSDEGKILGANWDEINRMEIEFHELKKMVRNYPLLIGHVPPLKIKPGQPYLVCTTFASVQDEGQVKLFYRSSPSNSFKIVPLQLENAFERTWITEIPSQDIQPGRLEYHFEAGSPPWGAYGSTLDHGNPYIVLVNDNNSKPVIEHTQIGNSQRGPRLKLEMQVASKAKIGMARVYYKRMPAEAPWICVAMQSAGGGRFQTRVPLTPEGILYYFDAVDEDGNATRHPDFLERTPYYVIDAWPRDRA